MLKLFCKSRIINDISTLQIHDPSGVPVPTVLGVFSIANITRSYAGVYTCLVTSTIDNSTVNTTSVLNVKCKLTRQ